MVEAAPAQAPALEEPVGFEALSDDLVLRALLRAPFTTHGTLHIVCHRFKSLLRSDAFRDQRLDFGLAERGVVIAGGRREDRVLADSLMLTNGRWRPIPPMSAARAGACSVIIDNEMWVIGGRNDAHNALATVEIYSPKSNSWRSCTPMSQSHIHAVAGVVGGRLVVATGLFGGVNSARLTPFAEAYTGTAWTPIPHVPHAVNMATACVLNGRLHVIGGVDRNTHQVLEMTEENGLSWSCKAELPASRHGAASVVHEGMIWVMGGQAWGLGGDFRRSASVIKYDAEADTWDTAAPLPSPCSDCRAFSIEGGIFLCGRAHGSYSQCFEYRNGAWSEVAGGDVARYPACGSVLLG